MERNALRYLGLTAITIVLGLVSRRFPGALPAALGKYPGDVLWGLMVFWIWALLLRNKPTQHVAITSALFALCIEFFKCIHISPIDHFRTTVAGKLLLGVSFSWINLTCYLLGILFGALLETRLLRNSKSEVS